MAHTALYRIVSGEVVKISHETATKTPQQFAERNTAYWGVLQSPTLPDGVTQVTRNPDGTISRTLGEALWADVSGNAVLVATQPQIDAYAAGETADEHAQEADRAKIMINVSPRYRKVFKALLKRMLQVTNSNAAQINGIKSAIAGASNLAEIRTAVAALPTLPDSITLQQAITALLNDVSGDD